MQNIAVFSGNSNPKLSKQIADNLNLQLGNITVSRFNDGEINVKINENVRGKDIFIIQSTCKPANEHLMELLIMADAFARSSARSITAVIPYLGYTRQDRRAKSERVPITAKLVADMICSAKIDRVLTIDLHSEQVQGFYPIPVDNIYGEVFFIDYIKEKIKELNINSQDIVLVSPDIGGVERTRKFAKELDSQIAIVDKTRPAPSQVKIEKLIGNVKNKTCILIDDIIDSANTITKAAKTLKENGANHIIACCSHPVLSKNALELIEDSVIEEIAVLDTIPLNQEKTHEKATKKLKLVNVDKILAEAITRVINGKSLKNI